VNTAQEHNLVYHFSKSVAKLAAITLSC
jgi:hypothetical protein